MDLAAVHALAWSSAARGGGLQEWQAGKYRSRVRDPGGRRGHADDGAQDPAVVNGPAAGYPDAGDVLRMVRSGRAVTIGARLDYHRGGVVCSGVTDGGDQVAVAWYQGCAGSGERSAVFAALASAASPHRALAWPADIVQDGRTGGFGYVMPLVPERFVSFAQLVSAAEQPSFGVLARIGCQIADAFAALHAAGWHFRAVDFSNLLADPGRGEVVILVADDIGPEGEAVFVWGTPRFMAPELLGRQAGPSAVTDLHSLAVILFYLLVHGHPLEGKRAAVPAAADEDDELERLYTEPLFVFDPADRSNAPPPGDPMITWWPIYPRFLQDLFTRAFTAGLAQAPVTGRVTGRQWHQALERLADSVARCSCGAEVIWDPDRQQPRCWNCGAVPPAPPLLEVPGHTIALAEGTVLTTGQLSGGADDRTQAALVEGHPTLPGSLVLRNTSRTAWTAEPAGEQQTIVPPGRRVRIRPMAITFGTVRGAIQTTHPPD